MGVWKRVSITSLLLLAAVTSYTVASQDGASAAVIARPGAHSDPVSIIFDSEPITVNPGDGLSLDCGVSGDYRYCHWENGRDVAAIQVEDVYDGYIDGLSKPAVTKGNECGIVINSVTIEDHGSWTCKVYVLGHTIQDTKNVTVTIRPTSPVLEVPSRPLIVNEGDRQSITCSVAAARPKVSFHWLLGDEDVTYSSRTENSLTDNMGTYKSISTLDHMFEAWHNNKALRCIVSHYTLETPIEDYVDIGVRYKPWGKDARLYGVRLGDDVEARVNFSSNPLPLEIKWGYGPSFEDVMAVLPVPGEEGRYSTEMLSLENGHYSVILRILAFDESDARMAFKVSVVNDLGIRDFRVIISNDKPPSEPLSTAALAAIVIVVLATILVVATVSYMKYNKIHCFARRAESKAYIQDGAAEAGDFHHTMAAHNEAIKVSSDHVNGNYDNSGNVTTFNGNGKATAIDHNDFTTVPIDEKINTDV